MCEFSPRHDELLAFAQRHVCISRQLRQFFPSRRVCSRHLAALRRDGWLRSHGRIGIDQRWPQHFVYCNGWNPNAASLRHDVLLTDFWSAFAPTLEFECHPKLVNQQLLPDLEITLPGGIRALVELDLGTEPLEVIRQKNQRYAGACDPHQGPIVVYVTLGKKRLSNLMAVAGPVAKAAYFTTLSHVMRENSAARFMRADGRLVVLYPRA